MMMMRKMMMMRMMMIWRINKNKNDFFYFSDVIIICLETLA